MEEIWKDIKGYEGLYQISSFGRVKSLERKVKARYNYQLIKEKIRKLNKTTAGYLYVVLSKKGVNQTHLVHRLVAEAFLQKNEENLECINHIDENKENNSITNLEWCSYQYNNTYKNIHLRRNLDAQKKIIIQYDLDMNEIKRWNSLSEIPKVLNISISNVIACCNYKRNHCGGYKWRYYE